MSGYQLPFGSYQQSSRNARIEEGEDGVLYLVAECARVDGSWKKSRLRLVGISNQDGTLRYDFDASGLEGHWKSLLESGDVDGVSLLLKLHPSLAERPVPVFRADGSSYFVTPLSVANKSLSVTRLLVAAGADVNGRSSSGSGLPLHQASSAVAEFLLDNGADPNGVGYEGGTVLMNAAYMAEAENTELLIQRGADVNIVDEREKLSPLHCACFYSKRLQGFATDDGFEPISVRRVVRSLLDAGANVHACCAVGVRSDCGPVELQGETPLHFAAAGGDCEVVSMLLEAGANATAKNSNGETPADWSRKYYGGNSVEELLQGGG